MNEIELDYAFAKACDDVVKYEREHRGEPQLPAKPIIYECDDAFSIAYKMVVYAEKMKEYNKQLLKYKELKRFGFFEDESQKKREEREERKAEENARFYERVERLEEKLNELLNAFVEYAKDRK